MLLKLKTNVMLRTITLYNHQFLDMYLIQYSPIKLKIIDVSLICCQYVKNMYEMIFYLVQVAVKEQK